MLFFSQTVRYSIDTSIYNLAKEMNTTEDPIILLKRFLDDLFLIWRGKVQDLEAFLEQINNLHPTIKFTSSYTCPFPCTIDFKIIVFATPAALYRSLTHYLQSKTTF